MSIFSTIGKGIKSVGKVVTAPVKLAVKAEQGIAKTVAKATVNTPFGKFTKAISDVKLSANPIKTIGSAVKAQATIGKALFSKDAAAIGTAAFSGGASLAGSIKGLASGGISLDAIAKTVGDSKNILSGLGPRGGTVLGVKLGGAQPVRDVAPKTQSLNAVPKQINAKNGAFATAFAVNKEDLLTTLIKLPFRILGLVK